MRTLFSTSLLLAFLVPGAVLADPLKNPKRLVHDQTIDLTPLFIWSANHQGARPLRSWVQVTGKIAGTNSLGWMIEVAGLESSGGKKGETHKRVILRNPPVEDLAGFQKLLAETKAFKDERAKIFEQQRQAKEAADTIAKQRKAPHTRAASHTLAAESRQVQAIQSEDKKRLTYLDGKIREMNSKLAAYPKPDQYVVDCFALDTGERSQATPVYDHGFIVK